MKKMKYLSELLETDSFFKGTLNVVVAPCGCGKSHAAINVIAPMASKPSKALYLIDTTAGCQRIANEQTLILPTPFYGEDIASKRIFTETDKKIIVTTYAKFGVWCSRYPNFADHFEVIMDYFIVHNSNPTHIAQARGRYRGDLDTLYLLDKDKGTVYIPEKYIDRPLFKEDKSSLNQDLFIKNDKGRFIPWSQLSQMITDSGYTFAEGKDGNRPYTVIHRL